LGVGDVHGDHAGIGGNAAAVVVAFGSNCKWIRGQSPP